MRILLVDSLLEQHLTDSLARALTWLGHTVHTTGPLVRGWKAPTGPYAMRRIERVVDAAIERRTDVVVAMRPSTLRPEQLDRLRRAGVRTVAWFADDPVFYTVQSRELSQVYDLSLHTATGPTLQMYEDEVGVRGWNFPFYTDDEAFPRLYEPRLCDVDVVFIGNTHTKVKMWRYDALAALGVEVALYGQVKGDPAGIHAGTAPDNGTLALACARGRFGLNISQRFADYAGSEFDYPRLAGFGEFSLPSRIVQLAAVGVPTISWVSTDEAEADHAWMFPTTLVIRRPEQVRGLVDSHDLEALRALSERTHAWYASHYTARSRAAFLTHLLAGGAEAPADADQRARAYLGFPTPTFADQGVKRLVGRATSQVVRAELQAERVVRAVRRRLP